MILVDTSVWIHHLRSGNPYLVQLLEGNVVAVHDFVIGEMACGNLKNRQKILSLLSSLPRFCMQAIKRCCSSSNGSGLWAEASATIGGCRLWTDDRKLAAIAEELEFALL